MPNPPKYQQKIGVAAIGAGYWGINHVRTFAAAAELHWVCDPNERARAKAARLVPAAQTTADVARVLEDPRVQAVVIATPAATHAALALQAIARGKHILVEKPLALSTADAESIAAAAADANVTVMVGHLLLYHPAVEYLRTLIDNGELGDLHYMYASRVNLGRIRHDENALWSFAPHDYSMITYLMGQMPVSVTARGASYLQPGIEDVVFSTLRFAGGQMAHVHLSWLNPRKERRLTIVGSQKMVEFDDTAAEKLRIHDRGYERPPEFTRFDEYLSIRNGDIYIPHLDMVEPLATECAHFLDCIQTGRPPRTGITSAVNVVKILAAAQQSLEQDGAPVEIR